MSISVCVESYFQSYKSGIYGGSAVPACTNSKVNHVILLVGYDMSASTPYWIAKNQVKAVRRVSFQIEFNLSNFSMVIFMQVEHKLGHSRLHKHSDESWLGENAHLSGVCLDEPQYRLLFYAIEQFYYKFGSKASNH